MFEDFYFSPPEDHEQGEVYIPVNALAPFEINHDNIQLAEMAIEELSSSPISGSLSLALRWFAKALMTDSPTDKFIGHFVGLDVLVVGYFESLDPSPVRKQTQELIEYFDTTSPKITKSLKSFLLDRVADFPLSAKFDAYIQDRSGDPSGKSSEFRVLNRLRGELLHGKLRSVSPNHVNQIGNLLDQCLAQELHLYAAEGARTKAPSVLQSALEYALVPRSEHQ